MHFTGRFILGLMQVMVHEGVESKGKAAVLRKLGSVCELQHALGTNRMVVDTIQMQSENVSHLPAWHHQLSCLSCPLDRLLDDAPTMSTVLLTTSTVYMGLLNGWLTL